MPTKVIGIQSGYSSSLVELPFSEKVDVADGQEVIFKDKDGSEEYGIIKYVNRNSENSDEVLFNSKILRRATPHDIQKVESFIDMAKSALKKCQDLIDSGDLDIYGNSLVDNNQNGIEFLSNNRVMVLIHHNNISNNDYDGIKGNNRCI